MSILKTLLGLGGAAGSVALAPWTGGTSLVGLMPSLSLAKGGAVDDPQYEQEMASTRLKKAYAPYTQRNLKDIEEPKKPDSVGDAIGSLGYSMLFAGMNPGGLAKLGSGVGGMWDSLLGSGGIGGSLGIGDLTKEFPVGGLQDYLNPSYPRTSGMAPNPMDGVVWRSPNARFIQ